jgi:DNA-directed RNA polymerase specialized sigma24 family protein
MAGSVRGVAGRASRGVVREIDEKLRILEEQLEPYEALVAERDRLLAARAAVTGERAPRPVASRRVTQEDLLAFLVEHPGLRAGEIAEALGVSLATISSHLYRGNHVRFERREDGWHPIEGQG